MTLELQRVTKTYQHGDVSKVALKDVTLKIKKESFNLIIGPSGSGKSTLINIASLLNTPTSGEIIITGKKTSTLSKNEKFTIRRDDIGIIYQRDNLFPYLNVLENVTLSQNTNDKEYARELLNQIGLKKESDKFPSEISIFNQQKTALARALINKPSIILADEPTGELNYIESEEYLNLIKKPTKDCAVLVVSDDTGLEELFDNRFFLSEGNLK
ncbi:MAG: ATP-binding cassette domain-containing protein [Methanobacterium sp.]|nr:ATP-binding cassette domain-containing protein [Methanobacterium sp.]